MIKMVINSENIYNFRDWIEIELHLAHESRNAHDIIRLDALSEAYEKFFDRKPQFDLLEQRFLKRSKCITIRT